MLSGKSKQKLSAWCQLGIQNISQLLAPKEQEDQSNLVGLVINPQHIKLLKINRIDDQYEIEYMKMVDLPEGLILNNEIKDCDAVADILKNIFDGARLNSRDVAFAIPRSSAIVKTITVDNRLLPDEIESRVWLEASRLFPNLIDDVYLDFVVNGPAPHDSSQIEILVVACRKDQLTSYLDVMRMAGLNAKVVDINYYAYERALSLINKQLPQIKTIALLNISFKLIDLIVIHEGNPVYTHELSYDGTELFRYTKHKLQKVEPELQSDKKETMQAAIPNTQTNDILKNTIGLHLKHAMQFFYSSRPNTRLERIFLSGDAVSAMPNILEYVQHEVGKEIVLADPFKDMKISAKVDKNQLEHHAPAFMLCCGLALTKLIDGCR